MKLALRHFRCQHRGWGIRRFAAWRVYPALVLMLLVCAFPYSGFAQKLGAETPSHTSLPDAPGFLPSAGTANGDTRSSSAFATVSGAVLDANGQPLEGAHVSLSRTGETSEQVLFSDVSGQFTFGNLPAGTYKVTITSPGMETFISADMPLRSGERHVLPQILLGIAGTTVDVQVSVTQVELAREQVKAAEKQRALGIFPNFYSSYIWKAAPMSVKQKFDLGFHSVGDPVEFIGTGIIAGGEQIINRFPGYGGGAEGYAKRYGAAYADDAIARMLSSAVLPSLLHQDPRYFYKGTGSVRSRIIYAVSRAVITRGDNGRPQPNYSFILGSFATGAIANTYHPATDRGVGLTVSTGLIDTAGNAANNLFREFLLRRLTTHVPAYENGQSPK